MLFQQGCRITRHSFYISFSQLIRENNKSLDKTFVYSYNGIGNITSVKTYAYTTAPIPGITYTEQAYGYKFKGVIYDCGGELTGAYAKEIALTKGYEHFVNIWLL